MKNARKHARARVSAPQDAHHGQDQTDQTAQGKYDTETTEHDHWQQTVAQDACCPRPVDATLAHQVQNEIDRYDTKDTDAINVTKMHLARQHQEDTKQENEEQRARQICVIHDRIRHNPERIQHSQALYQYWKYISDLVLYAVNVSFSLAVFLFFFFSFSLPLYVYYKYLGLNVFKVDAEFFEKRRLIRESTCAKRAPERGRLSVFVT